VTIPIALQLYSVRDEAKRDLAGTIRRVAAMGYEAVEFAGFHGHDAGSVRKMLDDAGLRCAGSHAAFDLFSPEKIEATLAFHRTIGCPFLIVPWLAEDRRSTAEQCAKTAREMTALTERVGREGFRFGFHCHAQDMKPIDGERSAWDLLAAGTPQAFILQYDTANGMQGGADPVTPLLAHPGRGATTHLKAYAGGGHGRAVIGEDEVPWDRVLDACEQTAGTQWYVVEQEGHPSLPPMDAAERSLKNLREILAKR
jgi:sugar phosphate isomerase/epimerase